VFVDQHRRTFGINSFPNMENVQDSAFHEPARLEKKHKKTPKNKNKEGLEGEGFGTHIQPNL
jgi:hypothetical protein